MSKPTLRVGLIGAGFMGKAHAFAYGAAGKVFDLPYRVKLHTLADANLDLARRAAEALGFAHATDDWRAMVADPRLDVVSITALLFTQERLNELHFCRADDPPGRRGSRRIEAAPDHPPCGRFCVAPGHQLGLKAIEVAGFLDALAGRAPQPFPFREGLRVQALVETIQASARKGRWVEVA